MHIQILPLIAIAITLTACSPGNGFLSQEESPPRPAVEAPAASANTPEPDAWCRRVAASERDRAQQQGFDPATLDRMALSAYQQCRALSPG